MQKFRAKLKNTPTDVKSLLVRSSVNSQLNKDESLSVENGLQNSKLTLNNPEGVQSQHTERSLKSLVYVISKEGSPLMPCSPAKANRMLKKGSAKVIKRIPFTIQLMFECENQTQSVTLGIDTGYQNIGFSAVSDSKELISGTVLLENKMPERLKEKVFYFLMYNLIKIFRNKKGNTMIKKYCEHCGSKLANSSTVDELKHLILGKELVMTDAAKEAIPVKGIELHKQQILNIYAPNNPEVKHLNLGIVFHPLMEDAKQLGYSVQIHSEGVAFFPLTKVSSLMSEKDIEKQNKELEKHPKTDHKLFIAYETTTPESTEQGDFASHGEHDLIDIDEDDPVEDVVQEMKSKGIEEASASFFHKGMWYISPTDEDYSTGETTRYTYHLKGFSQVEEKQVYDLLKKDRLI